MDLHDAVMEVLRSIRFKETTLGRKFKNRRPLIAEVLAERLLWDREPEKILVTIKNHSRYEYLRYVAAEIYRIAELKTRSI